MNGFRGERLIERLGLGVDGHAAERLAQQRARDAGKLGGVRTEPGCVLECIMLIIGQC